MNRTAASSPPTASPPLDDEPTAVTLAGSAREAIALLRETIEAYCAIEDARPSRVVDATPLVAHALSTLHAAVRRNALTIEQRDAARGLRDRLRGMAG